MVEGIPYLAIQLSLTLFALLHGTYYIINACFFTMYTVFVALVILALPTVCWNLNDTSQLTVKCILR